MKLVLRIFSPCSRHNYIAFTLILLTVTTVKTGKVSENTFTVLFSEFMEVAI